MDLTLAAVPHLPRQPSGDSSHGEARREGVPVLCRSATSWSSLQARGSLLHRRAADSHTAPLSAAITGFCSAYFCTGWIEIGLYLFSLVNKVLLLTLAISLEE